MLEEALNDYLVLERRVSDGASAMSLFEIHWRAAKTMFFLSENHPDVDVQMRWITAGESMANAAMTDCDSCVEGYYFAAVLKGRRAEKGGRGLAALKLVKEVRDLGQKAAAIDPAFENAAPLRLLAMLYAKAPSWPTSVGDIDLAFEYARRALEISDYPMNHLTLAEVFIADDMPEQAKGELNMVMEAPIEGLWGDESIRWRPIAEQLLADILDQ
ncbi:MAG: hypothetical protein JXR76_15765 [Deltaproteobacteria bacterium]|nr:hypothetical protein [Deltaproteobacteria bacterium]